ncbi:MAG: hypothetical protein R3190_16045, partial [Thermoanaerobaculia bacterium]|nr:hypothetical protein [Thermoanaerobaculia bacterium]
MTRPLNAHLARAALFAYLLALPAPVAVLAAGPGADDPPLSAVAPARIVAAISEALEQTYVFEDKAREMIALLDAELERGAYAGRDSLESLAADLTEDLQSVSHDLHLRVWALPPDAPPEDTPEAREERRRRFAEAARADNYGFHKVEILPGNVGYIDLRGFREAAMGGET